MAKINFANGQAPALNADTLNQMQTNIENAIKDVLKISFPIGQTYITQTDVNPSTILGFGTWERVKGKVLVGLDEDDTDFNTIGKTGGEKTHTLTINEMPNHQHDCVYLNNSKPLQFGGGGSQYNFSWSSEGFDGEAELIAKAVGGDQSHNNLQPYRVVGYMWIRTA